MTETPTSPTPPTPPTSAPAAFPAPAVPAWGQGAAPAPATKRKQGSIVVAAAAAVGVLGGAFGLVGLLKDDDAPAVRPNSIVVAPDPGAGPALPDPITPVTVPGPQPPPTVVTTTIPPATTTTVAPTRPATDGTEETVPGTPLDVAVPGGWQVARTDTGYVLLTTQGAEFRVLAVNENRDAESLAVDWVGQQELDQMVITSDGPAQLPSGAVVSAHTVAYEAVLVTQQGSIPVEAVVLTYVTQDGIGIILETFNAVGQFGDHAGAYLTMTNSVVRDL